MSAPFLDRGGIEKILPHRGGALILEEVLELEPGQRAVGIKRVRADDPFLEGHFPERPVMPAAAIIELMAQVAGVLTLLTIPEHMRKEGVALLGLDKTRFRRPVFPGDEITVEVTIVQRRDPIWKFTAVARVGEEKVAEADLLAGLTSKEERALSVLRSDRGRER
jgi:3-hydroxyacyl-[acyl-carrier-protein] dehydratase